MFHKVRDLTHLIKFNRILSLIIFLGPIILQFSSPEETSGAALRIAYWQLDELGGPSYNDLEGQYNGTCSTDCPTSVIGQVGGAQAFNGISTGIDVLADASLDWSSNQSFSVEFWVKAVPGQTCSGSDEEFLGRFDPTTGMRWSFACDQTADTVHFILRDTNGSVVRLESTKAINDGNWHHISGMRNGTSQEDYLVVDGGEVISTTHTVTGDFSSSTAPINIGYLQQGTHFQGILDEIAIYVGIVSPTEIKTHYYLGRGYAETCSAPIRIMPLGDSITRGSESTLVNGYRRPLYLSLGSAGYDLDFVGSRANGQSDFDTDHEGHSGFSADGGSTGSILPNIYDWLVQSPADVILLHIGTNDIQEGHQDAMEVSQILDEIDRYSENVTVVLALIINEQTYNPATTQFNADLDAMAANRIAAGDKIMVVDMEHALTYPDDMSDLLHPNDGGYAKMATVWENPLMEFLPLCPQPPKITTTPVYSGVVDQSYTYDVDASGNPSPSFSLFQAPNGMNIDPDSGVITWIPSSPGEFNVSIQATNSMGTDTQSFSITVNLCGGLVQEAELGTLSGMFAVGVDSAASGGEYIHVPDGSGDVYQVSGNGHQASYCFTVSQAGTYRLTGWVYAANTSSNSFYVQIDGNPAAGYLWNLPKTTKYRQDYVNDWGVEDPVEVVLGAGEHQVIVYLREDGARLDKLEFELVAAGTVATSTPTP